MALILGIDEAGYGPNLGPLVITASLWEVPGVAREFDFYREFEGFFGTPGAPLTDAPLPIADSKVLYQSGKGITALERGVLAAIRQLGTLPISYQELISQIALHPLSHEPWLLGSDLELPRTLDQGTISALSTRLSDECQKRGVCLRALRSDLVETARFNSLVEKYGNKSTLLSCLNMELISSLLQEYQIDYVIADKHGGRNRYQSILQELSQEHLVLTLEEGPQRSRYRLGEMEIQFQPGAEAHLPVALASMMSKYLREMSMELFNRFWERHRPGIRPTMGYPVDAARFRTETEELRQTLGIAENVFWRSR